MKLERYVSGKLRGQFSVWPFSLPGGNVQIRAVPPHAWLASVDGAMSWQTATLGQAVRIQQCRRQLSARVGVSVHKLVSQYILKPAYEDRAHRGGTLS